MIWRRVFSRRNVCFVFVAFLFGSLTCGTDWPTETFPYRGVRVFHKSRSRRVRVPHPSLGINRWQAAEQLRLLQEHSARKNRDAIAEKVLIVDWFTFIAHRTCRHVGM